MRFFSKNNVENTQIKTKRVNNFRIRFADFYFWIRKVKNKAQ